MGIPERFKQKPFDEAAYKAALARLPPPDPNANDDDLDEAPPAATALFMGQGKTAPPKR